MSSLLPSLENGGSLREHSVQKFLTQSPCGPSTGSLGSCDAPKFHAKYQGSGHFSRERVHRYPHYPQRWDDDSGPAPSPASSFYRRIHRGPSWVNACETGVGFGAPLICALPHLCGLTCLLPPRAQSLSSVQSLSLVLLFSTPWTTARQASLSITNSRSPPKSTSTELVMPSNHLILCHPLLLLPSVFPSVRVFSNESALRIRWPKYWSFSFNISPFHEHPGLISRMDWLDLLAVQGTLESLLQHHSSKASVLWRSVQLSHPYTTTGKTIALTRRTFVEKVMSLLFNMLSKLVITFLPRSKCLLISWLQSPSAVILEPKKIKSATVSTVSPSICHSVVSNSLWPHGL